MFGYSFFWQLFVVVVLDGNTQPALFPFRYKMGFVKTLQEDGE